VKKKRRDLSGNTRVWSNRYEKEDKKRRTLGLKPNPQSRKKLILSSKGNQGEEGDFDRR